jgi:hypothetical protein
MPRTKIEDRFTDRVGQQDLFHQHVVDGVGHHAAADGCDAALIVAQGLKQNAPRLAATGG